MGFEIINKLKKEKGITNRQLALMSGVTLSTIDKITSGRNTNPQLDTLLAICRVLGCKLEDFDPVSDLHSTQDIQLTPDEKNLVSDYRELSEQGQEYIRQTMYMARQNFKKASASDDSAEL